jgi:hypothetical protein
MTNKHFNDDFDGMNDDGYLNIHDEWLREEEAYFSEMELDPADTDEYDPVDDSDNSEAADRLDSTDEDWDWDGEDSETPIGLEYDGYNDADNY